MDKRHIPKIQACSPEDFQKKYDLILDLPEYITDQIESTEDTGVGLGLNIAYKFKTELTLYLPNYVTRISNFGEYIGIYAGKFFFKIDLNKFKDTKITYIFRDISKD